LIDKVVILIDKSAKVEKSTKKLSHEPS